LTLEESYRIIEGLIFAAPYPLTAKEIGEITGLEPEMVERLIHRIKEKYCDGGIVLRKVAGGYQLVTAPDLVVWIDKIGRPVVHTPLSVASLETLAIIAYRQPITRSEIEQIRGVRADSAINTLLERELIVEVGRKDGPGRPIIYGTSEQFLIQFGLETIEELPKKEDIFKLEQKLDHANE